jgi:hypothetical protein
MEMLARHHSMKAAELTPDEQVIAAYHIKTRRLNELIGFIPKT